MQAGRAPITMTVKRARAGRAVRVRSALQSRLARACCPPPPQVARRLDEACLHLTARAVPPLAAHKRLCSVRPPGSRFTSTHLTSALSPTRYIAAHAPIEL